MIASVILPQVYSDISLLSGNFLSRASIYPPFGKVAPFVFPSEVCDNDDGLPTTVDMWKAMVNERGMRDPKLRLNSIRDR
jgi:hypothetical protein